MSLDYLYDHLGGDERKEANDVMAMLWTIHILDLLQQRGLVVGPMRIGADGHTFIKILTENNFKITVSLFKEIALSVESFVSGGLPPPTEDQLRTSGRNVEAVSKIALKIFPDKFVEEEL